MALKLVTTAEGKVRIANMPTTASGCVDALYELQEQRRKAVKHAKGLASAEHDMEQHMIKLFGKQKLDGAVGQKGQANLYPKEIAQIDSWTKFVGYVVKNKAFDMLQKRLSPDAVNERLMNKVTLTEMGLKMFKFTAISCTKKNAKKGNTGNSRRGK